MSSGFKEPNTVVLVGAHPVIIKLEHKVCSPTLATLIGIWIWAIAFDWEREVARGETEKLEETGDQSCFFPQKGKWMERHNSQRPKEGIRGGGGRGKWRLRIFEIGCINNIIRSLRWFGLTSPNSLGFRWYWDDPFRKEVLKRIFICCCCCCC